MGKEQLKRIFDEYEGVFDTYAKLMWALERAFEEGAKKTRTLEEASMEVGDTVIFTNAYGEPPTESAAIVTKVQGNGNLDLTCFFLNELFFRLDVPQGAVGERQTWRPKTNR
jgi:hypothetical protein